MTDFDSLREDIADVLEAVTNHSAAQNRLFAVQGKNQEQLWTDVAELRDELHALANRVEALTRARLTEPAEVAEAMVSPSRWHRCECGVDVRRSAADGLIYDALGQHTCSVARIMDRRQT